MTTLIHVNREGEWLDSPVNLADARLVVESRKGTTQVWRNPDGKLYQVYHLKSGNIELTELDEIPDYLTVRY